MNNSYGEAFLKLFCEGTSFENQNSSADHHTLVSFEMRFINFVAYFKGSILIYNFVRVIIDVRCTVRDYFNVQTGCR